MAILVKSLRTFVKHPKRFRSAFRSFVVHTPAADKLHASASVSNWKCILIFVLDIKHQHLPSPVTHTVQNAHLREKVVA